MPPTTLNGKMQGALLVSKGVVIQGGDMHVVDMLEKNGEINKEIHSSENDKAIEPPGEASEKDGEINKEIHPSENDKVIEPSGEAAERDGEINKEIHPSENDKVIEPPGEAAEKDGEINKEVHPSELVESPDEVTERNVKE